MPKRKYGYQLTDLSDKLLITKVKKNDSDDNYEVKVEPSDGYVPNQF